MCMKKVQRLWRSGQYWDSVLGSGNPLITQGEDIVCSCVKAQAGVGAHRVKRVDNVMLSSDLTGQQVRRGFFRLFSVAG